MGFARMVGGWPGATSLLNLLWELRLRQKAAFCFSCEGVRGWAAGGEGPWAVVACALEDGVRNWPGCSAGLFFQFAEQLFSGKGWGAQRPFLFCGRGRAQPLLPVQPPARTEAGAGVPVISHALCSRVLK